MSYSLALPPRPLPSETAVPKAVSPEIDWVSITADISANAPKKASAGTMAAGDDPHGWGAIVAGLNAELPDTAIVGR